MGDQVWEVLERRERVDQAVRTAVDEVEIAEAFGEGVGAGQERAGIAAPLRLRDPGDGDPERPDGHCHARGTRAAAGGPDELHDLPRHDLSLSHA